MVTHGQRAPKQWQLTKDETITTFESWHQNLLYILTLDSNFSEYLAEDFAWVKKSAANPTRGLVGDGDAVPAATRKTAAQKLAQLKLMLGQIANYCPVISRNSITKSATSVHQIWQMMRQHFGFQSTGSHFLDLARIRREPSERSNDLYQRIAAFFDDSLLTVGCGIKHHGVEIEEDEDLSPTIENTVCVIWLQLLHPGLPQLIKQRYGAELRNKTLASSKPEIATAMDSLLEELRSLEDSKVLRTFTPKPQRYLPKKRTAFKSCTLCKTAGRPGQSSHNIIDCPHLTDFDRRSMGKSHQVAAEYEDDEEPETEHLQLSTEVEDPFLEPPKAHRVNIVSSPVLNVFYGRHPVRLTLDTGATANMVRSSFASHIGVPISPASQMARQADGVTPLNVTGEVHIDLVRGNRTFRLDAFVVEHLDVDILAGNPFLVDNDIATRPAKKQIIIAGKEIVYYGPKVNQSQPNVVSRRTQAFTLRSPSLTTVVMPGDYVEVHAPAEAPQDDIWALEPRLDSPSSQHCKESSIWPPPQMIQSVGGSMRIANGTSDPILLRRNEHFCQVRASAEASTVSDEYIMPKASPASHHALFSSDIMTDPDNVLSTSIREQFSNLHKHFDAVFNPTISKYNGHSGKVEGIVNMGPVLPPQRKGRLPQYNKDKLIELQRQLDVRLLLILCVEANNISSFFVKLPLPIP